MKNMLAVLVALAFSVYGLAAQTLSVEEVRASVIHITNATTDISLQACSDLATPTWKNIALLPKGSESYTNFHSGTQLFYRTANPVYAFLSLDSASPLTSTVPVTDTVNGQCLGLPILVVDIQAANQNLSLRSLKVNFLVAIHGNSGSIGAAYLFQGSTQVASASASVDTNGVATFSNIAPNTPGASVPANTSVSFTVKVDVTGLVRGAIGITAGFNGAEVDLASNGNPAWVIGSATGDTVTIVGRGASFSIAGTPSIQAQDFVSGTDITRMYVATFNVAAAAVGSDISFGLPPSEVPAFSGVLNGAEVYKNGAPDSSFSGQIVVGYNQPPGTTLISSGMRVNVAPSQTVLFTVTFTFTVKNPGANTYALQLEGIKWMMDNMIITSTFNGMPEWRTVGL